MLLAAVVALLAAVIFAKGVAEAKGGDGGRGGGGGKPSGNSSSKPSGGGGGSSVKSGPPTRIQDSSSPYYGSPNYGIRYGRMSNFFLWVWIFHDFDDDEYEEEYIQSNYGFGGWAVLGVGAVGTLLLIQTVRRRSGV
ncbi:MAG: hypothetical protein AVDCRST_MAG14-1440 [uncultured Rubrobacteraceae bacterium]|uniref:Uncharacterized protein n=1 Tax=uncultured Rubrobacteraceae bacterium TaxID=349277 RepID=A0A6J4QTP7_9ACTN|nr:MAG: hypothetical protein AVDCRST_MAG14-1440 [uncultured Rubrobacteraceae bacterium]